MIDEERILDIAFAESSEWASSLRNPEHCDVLGNDIVNCIKQACLKQEKATLNEIADWLEHCYDHMSVGMMLEGDRLVNSSVVREIYGIAANQLRARAKK